MREFLEACREASGGDASFTWVDDDFLVRNGVMPFSDLPFWLTRAEQGLLEVDVSKAVAQGLRCRPLVETVRDTARWLDEADAAGPAPARLASGFVPGPGLDRTRERALLDAWASRASGP
jgi:2'-hydroxyisoflavone reductase